MKVFDTIKSKDIDELAKWLDEYETSDFSPWIEWWDKNYCQKCDSIITYVSYLKREAECSWCEVNNKCKFFDNLDETPSNEQIIKMWLESEIDNEES